MLRMVLIANAIDGFMIAADTFGAEFVPNPSSTSPTIMGNFATDQRLFMSQRHGFFLVSLGPCIVGELLH